MDVVAVEGGWKTALVVGEGATDELLRSIIRRAMMDEGIHVLGNAIDEIL